MEPDHVNACTFVGKRSFLFAQTLLTWTWTVLYPHTQAVWKTEILYIIIDFRIATNELLINNNN